MKMRRYLFLFFILLATAGLCFGQGVRKDDIAISSVGSFLTGVPNASIRVCADGALGVPCNPLANVFSNSSLTIPLTNPFTADGEGNYFFYAFPGTYEIQITTPNGVYTQNDQTIPNLPGAVTTTFNYALVDFLSTPIFSYVPNTMFQINLSGNVSSSSLTGAPAPGNVAALSVCQNSVGGWTFVFPTNFVLPAGFVLGSSPNQCTSLLFLYNGVNWLGIGGGSSSSGGGNPALPLNSLQKYGVGGVFAASLVVDNGATTSIGDNFAAIGPNPYVDVTLQGVRAIPYNLTPAIPGITATCLGTACTLSANPATPFVNGDGIVVAGGGATNGTAAPAAPTVTCSLPVTSTNTGYTTPCPSGGSTNWSYKVAWMRPGGGVTAASPATTISNGASSLGAQNVTLSSCSHAGQVVSCSTSSAHGLTPGAMVIVNNTSDAPDFDGWFVVGTTPSNTQFTYSMGVSNNSSSTGGTAYWFNCNHIALPVPPSGVFIGLIYGRTTGSYSLIGVTDPVNSNLSSEVSYMTFDDYGGTMTTQPQVPYYVPVTAPATATNDNLLTTITAGGGGTALTVATAATNPVTNAMALFDDTPGILQAAANNDGGFIYFPVPPSPVSFYVTNSYMNLTANVSQAGALWVGGTIQFNGAWNGGLSPTTTSSCPQFCIEPHVPIYGIAANPVMYIPLQSSSVRNVEFQLFGNGYSGLFVTTTSAIPSFIMENVSFSSQCGTCDFTGKALSIWGPSTPGGVAGVKINNALFSAGPAQVTGLTATPDVVFKNVGELTLTGVMMNRRGLFVEPNQSGEAVEFKQDFETQGPIVPIVVQYSCGEGSIGGWMKFENTMIDTANVPLVANLGCTNFSIDIDLSVDGSNTPSSPGGGLLSGWSFANSRIVNAGAFYIGQNVNTVKDVAGDLADGNVSASSGYFGITLHEKHFEIGANYSLFSGSSATGTPTCSVATGTPSSPAGTWQFQAAATYPPYNGYGNISGSSNSCVSNGSNQQITITVPAVSTGASGYVMWANGAQITCTSPTTTTLSYTWTASACGQQIVNLPGAGPAGISGTNAWSYDNLITGYQDFVLQPSSLPFGNPPAGKCRVYGNNSGQMAGLNSAGGSCLSSGGGGSTSWNAITNPTGAFTPNMFSGATNYQTGFVYTGSGVLAQIFGWSNGTSATSSVSQPSPQTFWCGFAWHAAASVQSCLNIQLIPGDGTDANGTISFVRSGTDTGIYTSQFPGPVASSTSGSVGGELLLPENTCSGFGISATDIFCGSSGSHTVLASFNSDGPWPLSRTIFSGTVALATTAITSYSCQAVTAGSVNSVTAAGVLTTDRISWNPNVSLDGVSGYSPNSSGNLTIDDYPTSGFLNFNVCNRTGATLTPGALTLNVAVYR